MELRDFDQIAFAIISIRRAMAHWRAAATIALTLCEIEEATPLWRSARFGHLRPPPSLRGAMCGCRLGDAAKSKRGRPAGRAAVASDLQLCIQAEACWPTANCFPSSRPTPSRNTHLADVASRGSPTSQSQQGLTRRSPQARTWSLSLRRKPLSFGSGMPQIRSLPGPVMRTKLA